MKREHELHSLANTLKKQRDEIEVQLHLAGMEVKELWRQEEPKWESFIDKLGIINDDSRETSNELIHAAKVIGDELRQTYLRITERLGK